MTTLKAASTQTTVLSLSKRMFPCRNPIPQVHQPIATEDCVSPPCMPAFSHIASQLAYSANWIQKNAVLHQTCLQSCPLFVFCWPQGLKRSGLDPPLCSSPLAFTRPSHLSSNHLRSEFQGTVSARVRTLTSLAGVRALPLVTSAHRNSFWRRVHPGTDFGRARARKFIL